MTRAKKVKEKRKQAAPPPKAPIPRWLVLLASLGVAGGIAAAALL